MKTLLINHPTNQNLMLEIDVPDDEPEFLGMKNIRKERVQPIAANNNNNDDDYNPEKVKKEPSTPKTGGNPKSDDMGIVPAVIVDNSCLALVPELYDFVGMLANALSMHAYKPLLADPSKGWYEQFLPDKLCQKIYTSTEITLRIDDEDWMNILRHVYSAETFGGMLRSYQSLTSCIEQGITMRQLVESPVTNARFAELVAAMTRQGAGGSAQPGRFYGTGYQKMPQRWAYNVHAGIQFQKRNAEQIAYLKIWFTAIKMYDNKKLTYTTPDIPKSKYGFY